jgi:hypothetical protein
MHSAWIWDVSSTHSTTAAWGGLRYSPTMSRTLSTTCGSVDSFQVWTRCGLSPGVDHDAVEPQIRELVTVWP